MNTSAMMLIAFAIVLITIGVTLKYYHDTGRMVFLEHLKEDWNYRIKFRVQNNRYRGLNRYCYQFIVLLFYCVKSIVLLVFCIYDYILWGIYLGARWIIIKLKGR